MKKLLFNNLCALSGCLSLHKELVSSDIRLADWSWSWCETQQWAVSVQGCFTTIGNKIFQILKQYIIQIWYIIFKDSPRPLFSVFCAVHRDFAVSFLWYKNTPDVSSYFGCASTFSLQLSLLLLLLMNEWKKKKSGLIISAVCWRVVLLMWSGFVHVVPTTWQTIVQPLKPPNK